MKNQYAKEYYDTYLKDLKEDYKTSRWFSSAAAKLDYLQTRRSLKSALEGVDGSTPLEIGPGDGVWTDMILTEAKQLTLLDQSVEMIERAKVRLKNQPNISFVNQDFQKYETDKKFSLIFAIRCFEYFEDKDQAVQKFSTLVASGGVVIIVTKNPEHIKMSQVHEKELHTGQITKSEMVDLLSKYGFEVTKVLSATWRFKARYKILRFIFDKLHLLHIASGGLFKIPFLTNKLTESYTYVARKK